MAVTAVGAKSPEEQKQQFDLLAEGERGAHHRHECQTIADAFEARLFRARPVGQSFEAGSSRGDGDTSSRAWCGRKSALWTTLKTIGRSPARRRPLTCAQLRIFRVLAAFAFLRGWFKRRPKQSRKRRFRFGCGALPSSYRAGQGIAGSDQSDADLRQFRTSQGCDRLQYSLEHFDDIILQILIHGGLLAAPGKRRADGMKLVLTITRAGDVDVGQGRDRILRRTRSLRHHRAECRNALGIDPLVKFDQETCPGLKMVVRNWFRNTRADGEMS